jgi:hypothetical protein
MPLREYTGSVYCPKKLSQIAIGRCGEYQSAGCSCPNAATREQIDAVIANREQEEQIPERKVVPVKYSHLEWLRAERQRFQKELSTAESTAERLRLALSNMDGTLEVLSGNGNRPRGRPRKMETQLQPDDPGDSEE